MAAMNWKLQNIIIDPEISEHSETKRIVSMFPDIKPIIGKNIVNNNKKTLYLTTFKGEPLKPCPGTKNYICCMYTILHLAYNCPFNCEYCILKSYLSADHATFFVNHNELINKTIEEIKNSNRFFRVGTGELTDSLAFENIFKISKNLIEKFSTVNNAILELKTKSINIENFVNFDHKKRTFISFSINTKKIVTTCEIGCPSVEERLKAAKKCIEKGYKIGLHLDPAVYYENAEKDYEKLLYKCVSELGSENIVWISIGSMRGMSSLFDKIRYKNRDSILLNGEFITGNDSKTRYFKSLRIRLYNSILKGIFKACSDQFVYYCMENEEIWNKTLGFSPNSSEELGKLLDNRAILFTK